MANVAADGSVIVNARINTAGMNRDINAMNAAMSGLGTRMTKQGGKIGGVFAPFKSAAKGITTVLKRLGMAMVNPFSLFRKSEKSAEKDAKSFQEKIGSLGNSFRTLATVVTTAMAAIKLADMGSDLAEVQNVVDVTFTTMSDKINTFAESALKAYGISEVMAKKFAGTFGAMAKGFGFTEEQAYNMSTTLTALSGDVASFYNLSQEEAFTKLKGVFTGETEGLNIRAVA